jgi:tRNA (guanine26-N2/guanine27-N2)-dimethyltransferase
LNFSYPTETITEGKIKAVVPKHAAYKKKASDYAPSMAPVFYNPVMELNRDMAVLALQAFQRTQKRELNVSEPLTGSGLRGVRFAVEVEGIKKVVINDINPKAAKVAAHNAEINGVSDVVEAHIEDGNLFLTKHAAPKKRFDYVDVDPFGPPVPYLDSAVRSLRKGGMLALTATDMAPLCGVYQKACLRKYGGVPLRTEYCHEQAVRMVAGCLAVVAAKHEIGIDVVFSYSIDHYVRTYAVLNNGAKVADKSVQQMGYVLHCFSCFHRGTVTGVTSLLRVVCPVCGAKMKAAGPMWLGKIADKNFCSTMIDEAQRRTFNQQRKIEKMLSLIHNEAEAPATYYRVDEVCDKFNLPVPAQKKVLAKIQELGFVAVLTHFNSRGFKSDAPADVVREVVTKLVNADD